MPAERGGQQDGGPCGRAFLRSAEPSPSANRIGGCQEGAPNLLCEEVRQWEGGTEAAEAAQSDARVAGAAKLVQVAEIYQAVLAAYWLFVPGVCVHLVISGELAPGERLQAAEYCLTIALATFWQPAQLPADQRANENRASGPAWAATTETLEKLIVTLLMIFELSRIAQPSRGSVLGTMRVEHVFALVRGLCGTNQRAEALGSGFQGSVMRAKYRLEFGLASRLDRGGKRELCADVTFMPLPEGFERTPFGVVLSRVQGAMVVMGVPLSRIDDVPDQGSPVILRDVASRPVPAPPGAITTRKERYVSTAALNQRKDWESGRQIADEAGERPPGEASRPRLPSPCRRWLGPRMVVVPRVSSRFVLPH
jgi:hypothetical protein